MSKRNSNASCAVCGSFFYSYNEKNVCCSKKCSAIKSIKNISSKYEKKLGVESFKDWLELTYVKQSKSIRHIMRELDTKSNRTISKLLEYYEIPVRRGGEAIKAQWTDNLERKQDQADFMRRMSKGSTCKRKTFEELSKLYSEKDMYLLDRKIINGYSRIYYKCMLCGYQGDVSLGNRKQRGCPMCHINKITVADQSDVKTQRSKTKRWKKQVHERDNYKCRNCCSVDGIAAHHIESFASNKYMRTLPENGITLCEKCHTDFHAKYGYYDNNLFQIESFLGECLVFARENIQLKLVL